ncbi:putative RNA-directed DNA polymerase [Helianthus annuus]|nr:putative RNA-directed DNA polymerase [Helianthus annuus]
MNKMRRLKSKIIEWKKTWSAMEVEEVENLKAEVRDLDEIIEDRDLSEAEAWVFEEAKNRIRELEDMYKKDIKQKARVRWAREGDENNSFFHGCINMRRVSNNIPGLNVDGKWIFKPSEVKKEIHSFFKRRFMEEMVDRPMLECHGISQLSSAEAEGLVSPFSEAEIKLAVFECGSDKAPGPDGFNFRFLKRFWPLFSNDFFRVLQEFFDTG